MTLGDYIAAYRRKENYSQREFAKKCHLSNGYISMLERGFNHKTKEPIKPALPQLKKLADGMGITIMELFEAVDDMPVDISIVSESYDFGRGPGEVSLTEAEDLMLQLFRQIPEDKQPLAIDLLRTALKMK